MKEKGKWLYQNLWDPLDQREKVEQSDTKMNKFVDLQKLFNCSDYKL